jgi:dienelactone hydrolase
MADFTPETCHERGLAAAGRILRFDVESYPPEWVSAARRTFRQLLGAMPAACAANVRVSGERRGTTPKGTGYREIEFVFTSEPGADVPCWLLVPEGASKPAVMICLQGHSSGVHLSLGRAKSAADEKEIAEDGDYAIQAVDQGFAALAYEQRLFGMRGDRRHGEKWSGCHHASMTALLLGRTMAGERVLDVIRAIDALATVPGVEVDLGRIGIMGHSTGGLIAYYAAAIEPRISAVLASCSLCTYAASIATVDHCADNYLPGVMQYFEMADMAGLIAPRALVMVSGKQDPLFPHAGVETFAGEAREIYTWLGAAEKFRWVAMEGGHRFFGKESWQAFRGLAGW